MSAAAFGSIFSLMLFISLVGFQWGKTERIADDLLDSSM